MQGRERDYALPAATEAPHAHVDAPLILIDEPYALMDVPPVYRYVPHSGTSAPHTQNDTTAPIPVPSNNIFEKLPDNDITGTSHKNKLLISIMQGNVAIFHSKSELTSAKLLIMAVKTN